MISRGLVAALAEARRKMPLEAWQQLAERLGSTDGSLAAAQVYEATANLHNYDAASLLTSAFTNNPSTTWAEIAAAMTAVDYLLGDGTSITEIVWTGPANLRFPVRRIDQVLYDLIANAQRRILLVTFAAYRIPRLCDHLAKAVERGVTLTFIMESETESEGHLTRAASLAFNNLPAARNRLYYWPSDQRVRNAHGRLGKLHAKCAVVDDSALIGSANMTDDAFNRNIELGIVVREQSTVDNLYSHFSELIRRKILVPAHL